MKHLFYFITLITLLMSCLDNKYEKLITEYLETDSKTRIDLKIKYSKLEVSDLTVQDSIDILQDKYETEKQTQKNKLTSIFKLIKRVLNEIRLCY